MTSGFLPLILLYPEIHYRFKKFPFSMYYKKQPEILFDLPYKSRTGKFPVFLIIKDADLFPVLIWEIKFTLMSEDGKPFIKTHLLQKKFSSRIDIQIFEFDMGETKGFVTMAAEARFYFGGQLSSATNDNLSKYINELEIYINDDEELFDGFIQGDLHYHSYFTSDQVEFGAPAEAARICAACLGLDFFALTDHSYDLDDEPDDYLKNDPELKKFSEMKTACGELSDDQVTVIPGEEVTVRNAKNRNVHILAYDAPFFHGSGDSAEKWFSTRSENSIGDVVSGAGEGSLVIAAHPFTKVPWLEYLFVRRGKWSIEDITGNDITHIQILNGDFDEDFFKSIAAWVGLLLKGHRIFITAGNDAHGNFNIFRQVKIPMFSLISAHKQLFGKCRTVVFSESGSQEDIINSVKKGAVYITDGPHILFTVTDGGNIYDIGSEFKAVNEKLEAEFFITSSAYSGPIKGIVIYRGSIRGFEEKILYKNQLVERTYTFNDKIEMINDGIDHYIRIEVYTSVTHANGKYYEHRAYSNPVWIKK
ncbi:MAG TPA: CehA/McbA family metallohydrolase [Clostridiales bacterium]|nr:CehA/McbA family metallohydrolase [Clostridiales bacterium]